MHLDQPFDQSQTKPEPAVGSVQSTFGLGEQVKNVRQHVPCNTDTGVTHANDRLLPGAPYGHVDSATGGGVLGGVIYEVENHLAQTRGIGLYPNIGLNRKHQVMAARLY